MPLYEMDLRNSFTALKVGLPMIGKLISEPENSPGMRMYRELNINVHNVNTLLDNLLLWSVSQMNMMPIIPGQLDLHMLGEQNPALIHPGAHVKNIELRNEIPVALNVVTDENMVNCILRNRHRHDSDRTAPALCLFPAGKVT